MSLHRFLFIICELPELLGIVEWLLIAFSVVWKSGFSNRLVATQINYGNKRQKVVESHDCPEKNMAQKNIDSFIQN